AMIEQRRFELALWFDMQHVDMDAVMAFGQGFDAVNNRRAVVVTGRRGGWCAWLFRSNQTRADSKILFPAKAQSAQSDGRCPSSRGIPRDLR
ncbi:MAG: hypothetical protein ACXWXZ_20535, partial [Candidatus Binatia bacterium]